MASTLDPSYGVALRKHAYNRVAMEVDGREISISNADKPLFPSGITKGQLVEHYRSVAEVMVPHLTGRPTTLRRFPDGIDAGGFYQKSASGHFPNFVGRVEVPTRDGTQTQVRVDSSAALVYLANQAAIELHPWLTRADHLRQPDRLVIDLDPPEGCGIDALRTAVRTCGTVLDEVGLAWFLQTSGGKGFHLVVPLEPVQDHDEVLGAARALASEIAARDPAALTLEFTRAERRGRIYVDVGRNGWGQTSVAPYSVRARPGAPVATPIDRDELSRVAPTRYTIANIARRLAQKGDPWADIDRHRQRLGGRV